MRDEYSFEIFVITQDFLDMCEVQEDQAIEPICFKCHMESMVEHLVGKLMEESKVICLRIFEDGEPRYEYVQHEGGWTMVRF